jgi:hypothetical protein
MILQKLIYFRSQSGGETLIIDPQCTGANLDSLYRGRDDRQYCKEYVRICGSGSKWSIMICQDINVSWLENEKSVGG